MPLGDKTREQINELLMILSKAQNVSHDLTEESIDSMPTPLDSASIH